MKFFVMMVFLLLALTACNSEKTKALRYNDNIIIYQIRLMEGLEKLNDLIKGNDKQATLQFFEQIKSDVKEAIPKAEAVEVYPGGETMKEKVVDLLKFYEEMFDSDYVEYMEMLRSDTVPLDELEGLYTKIQFLELMAVQLERELGEAQDSFVMAQGIRTKKQIDSTETVN